MDQLDLAISASLEREGRQSFSGLADSVGLSKTPGWTRVQALEAAGLIRGYTADIDAKAIGVGVFAFIQLMIDVSRRAAFEAAVLQNPSILECYTTAGEADYGLKLVRWGVDGLASSRSNHTALPAGRLSCE
jgi:Lrp/AsnC family leucine-responsive transcriptional regulator